MDELKTTHETDVEIWMYDSDTTGNHMMSKGDYCITSFDSASDTKDGLISINLTNDTDLTAAGSALNVQVDLVSPNPNDAYPDYTGLKFSLDTNTSEYDVDSLKIRLWLNDDSNNAITKNVRSSNGVLNTTTHTYEVTSLESLFAPQSISDYDIIHYEFITN